MHLLIRNIMYSKLGAQISGKRILRLKISKGYGGERPQTPLEEGAYLPLIYTVGYFIQTSCRTCFNTLGARNFSCSVSGFSQLLDRSQSPIFS